MSVNDKLTCGSPIELRTMLLFFHHISFDHIETKISINSRALPLKIEDKVIKFYIRCQLFKTAAILYSLHVQFHSEQNCLA